MNCLCDYLLIYLALCGLCLSPKIAIAFSCIPSVPNFSMSHPDNFFRSSPKHSQFPLYVHQTSPCMYQAPSCHCQFSSYVPSTYSVPPCTVHILRSVDPTLVSDARTAALCDFLPLHPTTGIPLSSFWQVQVLCTNTQFLRFRVVHWVVHIRFHYFLLL